MIIQAKDNCDLHPTNHGHGKQQLHSGSIVKVELMTFADRLEVECERKKSVMT